MSQPRPRTPNPMAAIQALSGQQQPEQGPNIGPYVTASMLAAAANKCSCETCRLMRRAADKMHESLLEEIEDGGS